MKKRELDKKIRKMFKQNIRKKKHSKTRVKAIVAARVAAAKTLK